MTKRYAPGIGTTLSITPSGGSLTAIGQMRKIKPPGGDSEEIDVTDLDSTWIETLLSMPDGGELELTIQYDSANAGHALLWANFTEPNPVKKSAALWTLTFNDIKTPSTGTATIVTFNGGVKSWPFDDVDPKSVVTAALKVRVNGAVNIAAAT